MTENAQSNSNKEVSHVTLESIEVYLGQQRTFRLSPAGGLFLLNDSEALKATRDGMLQGVELINQFIGGNDHASA